MSGRIATLVLAAAMMVAAGCSKGAKKAEGDKGGAAAGPAAAEAPEATAGKAADSLTQAQLEAARKWVGEPKASVEPGEEYKDDPSDPDAPKYTAMQKKFFRLRDHLILSQVEQVMGGKPAESGEVHPGWPTWAAWNEGSRRFIVQMMNGRLVLWNSYDPKDTNGRYSEFQQVKVGMSKLQVRKLLGTSGKFAGSGMANVNGGTNVYGGSDNEYMIYFIDDKVANIIK